MVRIPGEGVPFWVPFWIKPKQLWALLFCLLARDTAVMSGGRAASCVRRKATGGPGQGTVWAPEGRYPQGGAGVPGSAQRSSAVNDVTRAAFSDRRTEVRFLHGIRL